MTGAETLIRAIDGRHDHLGVGAGINLLYPMGADIAGSAILRPVFFIKITQYRPPAADRLLGEIKHPAQLGKTCLTLPLICQLIDKKA